MIKLVQSSIFIFFIATFPSRVFCEEDALDVLREEVFFVHYKSFFARPPRLLKYTEILEPESIDKDCTIVFILHGWLGNALNEQPAIIRFAYQLAERRHFVCYEVFVIDYGHHSKRRYLEAKWHLTGTAEKMAHFITNHVKENIFQLEKLVVVGHSMGAHLGSFACEDIEDILGRSCPVLHGLDAPWLGFSLTRRFDKNSADCTTTTKSSFLGTSIMLGQKNFIFNAIEPFQLPWAQSFYCDNRVLELTGCPHSVSTRIFAITVVLPQKFPAYKCLDFLGSYNFLTCLGDDGYYMGHLGCQVPDGVYYVPKPHDITYGF